MVTKPSVGDRRLPRPSRPRRSWFAALAIVALETLFGALGVGSLPFAGVALLAPGIALAGLLPASVRRTPLSRWAMAPALGAAASSVALISVARLGIPLTGVSVRVTLLGLVFAGLLVRSDDVAGTLADTRGGVGAADGELVPDHGPGGPWPRVAGLVEGGLVAAVLVGAGVLAWRVVGTVPMPGNDWAKYLLYADEIAKHHHLLIDNPYWLGGQGVPFREDPGVPSLQGSALIMSGAPAGELARTIVILALALVLAMYGWVRASLGPIAGIATAVLVAFIPASQNILGWHGLANLGALVMLALLLAQLGAWLCGELDRRGEIGFGLVLVGIAAAHRLTSAITIAVIGVIVLARFLAPRDVTRREVVLGALRLAGWTVLLGLLVALDIRARSATAGGTLDYTSYLSTKLDPVLAARDLSWILMVTTGVSLLALLAARRLPRAVWPALAVGVVSLALAYVWIIHLPLYYARMVFYLPLGMAPIAGAGAAALARGLPGGRRTAGLAVAALVGLALTGVLYEAAWRQGPRVRNYYAFANPASLRGLDALAADLRPGEPVTTDRCWSFLSAWLLRHPTYPALADQDIGPKAELPLAREGRAMIEDTPEGNALIKKLGIRYALVDPNCPASTVTVQPNGTVKFVSQRLAIVKLSAGN